MLTISEQTLIADYKAITERLTRLVCSMHGYVTAAENELHDRLTTKLIKRGLERFLDANDLENYEYYDSLT